MRSLSQFLLLALLVSPSLSGPIRIPLTKHKYLRAHPLASSIELTNVEGMTYVGPLIVGSNHDQGVVTYDTGSTTCTIATAECGSCEEQVYDAENSDTAQLWEDGKESSIIYGSVVLNGTYYQDTVCVSATDCASSVKLLGITSQEGLGYGEDGILGLSPFFKNESSLVHALFNSGAIDKKVLGFSILSEEQQSVAVFGGWEEEMIAGEIKYIDLIHDFWWEVPLEGASYKGQSFIVDGKSAIIDTGSSYVFIPQPDMDAFGKMVMEEFGPDMYCEYLCIYQQPCSALEGKVEPLEFNFGSGQVFLATPDKYLIEGDTLGFPGTCTLAFSSTSGTVYTMGDIFLRNYYQIYDYENLRIGLAENHDFPKEFLPSAQAFLQ